MKNNDALQHQIEQGHITVITQVDHAGRVKYAKENPIQKMAANGIISREQEHAAIRYRDDWMLWQGHANADKSTRDDGDFMQARLDAGGRLQRVGMRLEQAGTGVRATAIRVIWYDHNFYQMLKVLEIDGIFYPAQAYRDTIKRLDVALAVLVDYYKTN